MSTTTSLTGKTALVTGASRGIGAGIARSLAERGATVAITYWSSEDQAQGVIEDIIAHGGKAYAVRANSADPESARQGVRDAVAALGTLDILVNNAGGGWFESFAEASEEHIEATINLNIRGTLYTTQEAIKHLPDNGRIITIGSINAESIPFPGGTVYGMSKASLVALTKGLARDLGQRGITVNLIQPGPIDTDGNPANGEMATFQTGLTALGRFGKPSDVGGLAAWIASDAASYMTGSTVNIDAGWTA